MQISEGRFMAPSKKQILGLAVAAAVIALMGYAAVKYDMIPKMISLVNEGTPTPLFITLMIILPIFGFPLSPFLLALGIKFGTLTGIGLMVACMPIHMIVSFGLVKVAGNFLEALLSRRNYTIPQISADKQIRFTFVIAAIPVAPYAVKNFLLALAGIPFRLYLSMNWGCQAVLATPAVILGGSIADFDPLLFLAAIAGLLVIYLVVNRIEKKYGRNVDLKMETQ